jgi:hypothetical protein
MKVEFKRGRLFLEHPARCFSGSGRAGRVQGSVLCWRSGVLACFRVPLVGSVALVPQPRPNPAAAPGAVQASSTLGRDQWGNQWVKLHQGRVSWRLTGVPSTQALPRGSWVVLR